MAYDVTNKNSFSKLEYWFGIIKRVNALRSNSSITIMVVGNKIDKKDEIQVSSSEGRVFSREGEKERRREGEGEGEEKRLKEIERD